MRTAEDVGPYTYFYVLPIDISFLSWRHCPKEEDFLDKINLIDKLKGFFQKVPLKQARAAARLW